MRYLIILSIIFVICACGKQEDQSGASLQAKKRTVQTSAKKADKGQILMEQLASISTIDPRNEDNFLQSIALLESTVDLLNEAKFIDHFEENNNRVYVNVGLWKTLSAEQKEDIARCLAYYCAHKRDVKFFWVELFNAENGQLICKYVHDRYCRIHL